MNCPGHYQRRAQNEFPINSLDSDDYSFKVISVIIVKIYVPYKLKKHKNFRGHRKFI